MAGKWASLTEGLRRRLGDLAPRERRALALLTLVVVGFGIGLTVFLVQSGLSARAEQNGNNAEVLRLVRERGRLYRDRIAKQEDLNRRLAADIPPLPSIVGEVLGELGQQRQDFQEQQPEPVGLAAQKRKPWIRMSVKFPMRKVPATTVYEFLLKLRERYPDLPLAVTRLDMRLDRSEDSLYNVEMVVSAYRLAERKTGEAESPAKTGGAVPVKPAAGTTP